MRFLDKHTQRDKLLLRLEGEMNRLRHAQWNAPLVPVERPYALGWVKTYILREDILRRADVANFQSVQATINQSLYARDQTFTTRQGDRLELQPRIIPPQEWQRLGWPINRRRLFEFGSWKVHPLMQGDQPGWSHRVVGYKLYCTWWLVEKVEPFIVTHQRVDLPEVRRRLAEIMAYFRNHQGRERLNRLHGQKRWWLDFTTKATDLRANATSIEQFENGDYLDTL